MFVLVCGLINSLLVLLILVWYLQEKGFLRGKTYCKDKLWMLVSLLLFNLIVVYRYMFTTVSYDNFFYATLLVMQQFFQAVSFLLICNYFMVKAERMLDNSDSIA